jgi:hypothetical protein
MAVPHSRSQVCSILVILLIVPHSRSQTLAHCLKTTAALYFVVSHVSHDPRHNLCSSYMKQIHLFPVTTQITTDGSCISLL